MNNNLPRIVADVGSIINQQNKQNRIKIEGAQAAIELLGETKQQNKILLQQLNKAAAQNELLSKQLDEQKELNARLENEFTIAAREAVNARYLSYWSLGIAVLSVILSIVIAIVK